MAEITMEQAPRKAREYFEKGFSAFERGNLDYAMDMFMTSLDLAPQFLRARKFLRAASIKKFKSGKTNALTHTLSSLSGLPGVLQANSQLKKKPEAALKTSELLLRKDPFNKQFIDLNCKAATACDMPEVCVLTLESARENFTKDIGFLRKLGKVYQDINRMHDARVVFEEIVRQHPTDIEAIKALKDATALDSMQKGGWTEAGSYRDVMKDSKEAILLEQQSKAVKTGKDVDDLIKETLAKIEREPQNINYKRSLADLYVRGEQFDEAIQVLQEAQKSTGGGDPQIERALSNIYLQRFDDEIEKARAAGDETTASAKEQEKEAFVLADAEDRVKRYPNDLQYRYELGVLQLELGRLNEAIQQFQLSQRNPQRRIRSLYYMALCFKEKQQYDIALEQLQKAASELNIMDDTKKDIVYELGVLSEAMGQTQQAAEFYKEIYSVDISYKDVSQKIEKFYKK